MVKKSTGVAALAAMCAILAAYPSAQGTVQATPEIRTKVEEYMNAAVTVNGFSGSILVAQEGQPVVNKGYGMANIELAVPNVVTPDNGTLVAEIAGRLKLTLAAESEAVFFSRDVSAQLTFLKDDAGQVTGLTLRMDGNDVPAQKVK